MLQEFPSTDKHFFEGGDVYHRYEGREEYLYNKFSVSSFNPNHFLSGHMLFILNNKQSGYVVVPDEISWKVTYLECAFK
jgi:hypothetical protein